MGIVDGLRSIWNRYFLRYKIPLKILSDFVPMPMMSFYVMMTILGIKSIGLSFLVTGILLLFIMTNLFIQPSQLTSIEKVRYKIKESKKSFLDNVIGIFGLFGMLILLYISGKYALLYPWFFLNVVLYLLFTLTLFLPYLRNILEMCALDSLYQKEQEAREARSLWWGTMRRFRDFLDS
jgi:hypothetical protein